jgi:hypothetical protein
MNDMDSVQMTSNAPSRSSFSMSNMATGLFRGAGWDQCARDSLPKPGCIAYSGVAPRRCDRFGTNRPCHRIGGRS